jgi:hypothetical protein
MTKSSPSLGDLDEALRTLAQAVHRAVSSEMAAKP